MPVLELRTGDLLSENAAVLQYVARIHPEAALAPTDGLGVAQLQQWLCFIGTELHKALFQPLLSKHAGPEAKSHALSLVDSRLSWVAQHLQNREFLLDRFTVADAYLFTILNWTMATPVELTPWPALIEYQARVRRRPSVERALNEELSLYRLQQGRHEKDASATPRSTSRAQRSHRRRARLREGRLVPHPKRPKRTSAWLNAMSVGASRAAHWEAIGKAEFAILTGIFVPWYCSALVSPKPRPSTTSTRLP